jgi:hypothetical protein
MAWGRLGRPGDSASGKGTAWSKACVPRQLKVQEEAMQMERWEQEGPRGCGQGQQHPGRVWEQDGGVPD